MKITTLSLRLAVGTLIVPALASAISCTQGIQSETAANRMSPGAAAATGVTITVAKSGGQYTTIQAGINAASAGDTVSVAAGTYNELVTINKGISVVGASGAIIDGTGKSTTGDSGLVIISASNVTLKGFEIRNFATTKSTDVPAGIRISAGISHITIQSNVVHNITTNEASNSCNAHGICCYGSSATANTDINIIGNEVYGCKLGQSETVVVNGNVNGFVFANNYIHDNDNIGFDAIGYEGTGPSGSDYARNGQVYGNTVKNISSASNKTYGGDRSADGIYFDGAASVIVERNIVDNCDIGIECASEHKGKNTDKITVRNNFVSRSYQANILAGGYASSKGNATNITIVNNTTYQGTGGEVALQYHCSNVIIKNNIFYGKSGQDYLQNWGGSNTGISVDTNIYYGASTSTPGSWTDAHAKYVNPQLVGPYANLHTGASSPAINAGLALGNDASGKPISGTLDIDGQTRTQGTAIDIGADEVK